jgi:N-acetylmuramoyl-L-alanine amidase
MISCLRFNHSRKKARNTLPENSTLFNRNTFITTIILLLYVSVGFTADNDWPLEITWPPRLSGYNVNAKNSRIAGYTHPEAKLRVNGNDTLVYPTGAFVAFLPLKFGKNDIEIIASYQDRNNTKKLMIKRPYPPLPFPDWPPKLKESSLFPGVPYILRQGDTLKFSCTAGTGNIVTVQVGDTETVIPLKESGGANGSYRGSWKIPESMEQGEIYFTYRMTSLTGLTATGTSKEKLVVLQKDRVDWQISRDKKTILYDSPENGRAGEIEAGVYLPVTGQIGRSLRLGLGKDRTFWISKPKSLKETRIPPDIRIEDIIVTEVRRDNGPARLKIFMNLPVRLPYYLWSDKEAGSIYLEIFRASLNNVPVLEIPEWFPGKVEIINNSDKVMIKVSSESEWTWGYSAGYISENDINNDEIPDVEKLVLEIRFPSRNEPPSGLVNLNIMIDPGHGGKDPGTLSPTNKKEKDFNLEISRSLEALLEEAGANVILARKSDRYLNLSDRVQMIENEDIDLFISIHNDSVPDFTDPLTVQGSTVYYGQDLSESLARAVNDSLLGLEVGSRGLRKANFAVIKPTRVPCILVECAYMSNPENEMFLIEKRSRKTLSLSIFKGIRAFAGRTELPSSQ